MAVPLRYAGYQDGRTAGGIHAERRPHDLINTSQTSGAACLAIDTGAMMGLLFGGALCQTIHKCSYRKKSTERLRLAHSVAFPMLY